MFDIFPESQVIESCCGTIRGRHCLMAQLVILANSNSKLMLSKENLSNAVFLL